MTRILGVVRQKDITLLSGAIAFDASLLIQWEASSSYTFTRHLTLLAQVLERA